MTSTDSARVAVVTAGAGAIGSAIVRALQTSGHATVVVDREGPIAADLGSEESTRQAAASVLERYGHVDVFVQCAATFNQATLPDFGSLALALGPDGIAVSSVAPGLTDTAGSRIVNSDADFDAVVGRQALKRRLVTEDTAEVVAFLASDGGAVMTGQVLCADAGVILR